MMDATLSGFPLSGGCTRYGFLLLWSLHDLRGLVLQISDHNHNHQRGGRGGDAQAHSLSGHFLVVAHLIALHQPELDYTPMLLG